MADNTTQQLFDLWKRNIDETTQAWARLMTQTASSPPPEATDFWRMLIDQGFQTWARALAQTPLTPDIMTQWKQLMDHAMEAWSRAFGQIMGTEAFAQGLGRTLDQFLLMSAPARKAADQSIEASLQTLNLPSRAQMTGVAKQIVDLEERIEAIEDGLGAILRRLDDIARALGEQAGRTGATREPR
jgi:hypothetical protein